jgi:Uma2 family endonuclease
MAAVTQLTGEEYLHMPETPGKHELLDGELISLPPAKRVHNDIARSFQELLVTVLETMRVRYAEGYRLRRGWLIADVSANWPDQKEGEWFEGAPMIAIEIMSPANTADAVDRKTDAYLEEGGAEVWIVYPASRTMKVYRNNGSFVRVTGIYECALIGLQLDLEKLLPAAE